MKDNSKFTAIILVVLTVIVVICSYLFKEEEKQQESKIHMVTNYSNFYTVNSCLYRTLTYISSNDYESLLLILDEKYKEKNNIDITNVETVFEDFEADSTFEAKKMYYQQISGNISKYYVYGQIEPNQIYDGYITSKEEYKSVYFIVYLDTNSKTFSVEPYDGDIFIGGDIDE